MPVFERIQSDVRQLRPRLERWVEGPYGPVFALVFCILVVEFPAGIRGADVSALSQPVSDPLRFAVIVFAGAGLGFILFTAPMQREVGGVPWRPHGTMMCIAALLCSSALLTIGLASALVPAMAQMVARVRWWPLRALVVSPSPVPFWLAFWVALRVLLHHRGPRDRVREDDGTESSASSRPGE